MGFRVWGLGFGVWGLGFGVWGLGFDLGGSGKRPFVVYIGGSLFWGKTHMPYGSGFLGLGISRVHIGLFRV